ncbi:MAG: hypothetical protein IAG13_33175, partial [Deltaproteobacteria bacterium]|nr:hypothetical protein [Nannocystaceae bacterium]
CGALLRVEVVPIDRIFSAPATAGAAVPATGATTTTYDGPTTTTVTADPELERKIKTWRTIGITSYALALATSVAGYIGIFFVAKASSVAGKAPGTERQDAIARHKLGIGLLAGGFSVAAAFLVLGFVSNARVKKLRSSGNVSARFGPTLVRGGGGVSVGINF